jgi:hypothetical protein
MRRVWILSLVAALLGGCVVTPVGYGYRDYDDGYYRHRDGYYSHSYRSDYYRGGWRDH